MINLDLPLEEYSELFSSAPTSDEELHEEPDRPCSCEDCKHYDDILYHCNADCCIIALEQANG